MLEALEITEDTYDIYLQMPLRENEDHLDLESAKDHYIVKDPKDPMDWNCISKENFNKTYKFSSSTPPQFRPIFFK